MDIFYNDNKICKKCGRNLPNTSLYYPIDKAYKTGLRNVCRECDPKYKYFLEVGHRSNEEWNDKDLKILESVYKDYSNKEIITTFFKNRTIRSIETIASKYGFNYKSEETLNKTRKEVSSTLQQCRKGRILSDASKEKMSIGQLNRYKNESEREKARKIALERGLWQGENHPIKLNPLYGKKNGRWKGGINPLIQELRSEIKQWKFDSMEFCDYLCIISGNRFKDIHHLTPFISIVDEAFDICNLDKRKQVLDYNETEFNYIKLTLNDLHNKYGNGICLSKEIHELFHKNYNYYNNTPVQFIEFVKRLENGEFDEWLKENDLQLNINYKIIDYIKSGLLLL